MLTLACSGGEQILQYQPVIESISVSRTILCAGDFIDVSAKVSDQNAGDMLTYRWRADGGFFVSMINNPTQWHAPDAPGIHHLVLEVNDGHFAVADSIQVEVRACP